jgi:hypothetical protein
VRLSLVAVPMVYNGTFLALAIYSTSQDRPPSGFSRPPPWTEGGTRGGLRVADFMPDFRWLVEIIGI